MRLLIVEDEKRLADTLRQLLHRQGYTADVSYDGVSGLWLNGRAGSAYKRYHNPEDDIIDVEYKEED